MSAISRMLKPQFYTFPFVLICVPHNNTPSTGCPVKGVHINDILRLLYQWVQNYKTKGYNGLVEMKKGRPSKGVPQMKKEEARPLNESEREELIRLRAENEYIKAENEVIKKEILDCH